MKHFFILALSVLALTATSCKDNPFKITYDFNISGDAAGDVAVTFPGGSLDMDGTAGLDFKYGNLDTTSLYAPVLKDAEKLQIAKLAQDEVFSQFSANTKAEGTYRVLIDCVVTEETTGAQFRWKKEFTNIPE